MKKAKSTEKLVRDIFANKMRVTTSRNLDERILANSISKPDEVKSKKSAISQLSIWSIVAKSKIAQIAAAAVIIIAACIFLTQQEQAQDSRIQQFIQAAESPGELTTFAALTFAYRRGGMEMVEQMCDRALDLAGPQPVSISMQELLEELNNGNSERKEL